MWRWLPLWWTTQVLWSMLYSWSDTTKCKVSNDSKLIYETTLWYVMCVLCASHDSPKWLRFLYCDCMFYGSEAASIFLSLFYDAFTFYHLSVTTTSGIEINDTTTVGTLEFYEPKSGSCPPQLQGPPGEPCNQVCGDDSHCSGRLLCCGSCCTPSVTLTTTTPKWVICDIVHLIGHHDYISTMEKHWPTSKLSHDGYWSKEDFNIDVCALHDGFYMSDQGYSRLLVCLYLFMFM